MVVCPKSVEHLLSIGRRASKHDDARVGHAAAPAAVWRYYIAHQLVQAHRVACVLVKG